jgi:type IV pilus assembly protein PilX
MTAMQLNKSTQRGATLMISLMILLVMTLIGITSMGTSNLEEKMAGNDRDQNISFQAAEAALRQAEDYVNNDIVSTAAFDGTNTGLYTQDSNPDIFDAATWANAITYVGTVNYANSAPQYIVEIISTIGEDDINAHGYGESSGSGTITAFRVTARGTGGTDGSVTLLQSNFGRRF